MPERRPPTSSWTMPATGPFKGNSISSPSGTYWSRASPRPSISRRAAAAPSDAMPRNTLYSRPPRRTTSPGLSGRPADRPPVMTVLAPAAVGLAPVPGGGGWPGDQPADHARARPGGDRLGHVAGVADAAVGDQGHPGGPGHLGAVEDGRELGDADPGGRG